MTSVIHPVVEFKPVVADSPAGVLVLPHVRLDTGPKDGTMHAQIGGRVFGPDHPGGNARSWIDCFGH